MQESPVASPVASIFSGNWTGDMGQIQIIFGTHCQYTHSNHNDPSVAMAARCQLESGSQKVYTVQIIYKYQFSMNCML